jgi:hopene-associated glycosyltransferase HpnB
MVPPKGYDPVTASVLLAVLTLAIWLYLIVGRGGFWRGLERDDIDQPAAQPERRPSVVAVVPARDEVDVAPRSIASLLAQDYPANFSIILVDDNSQDGTAAAVRLAVQQASEASGRLTILAGAPVAPGWTGKLWAVNQGVAHAQALAEPPMYLLLTDADIVHAPDALRALVARAQAGSLVLTSRMAKLCCASLCERALIPAFVFFFQLLYPFAWVNRRDRKTAAAAGGCMLVERGSLTAAGGIAAIGHHVIDDCALAAKLKAQGPIWLGLTDRVVSIRPYAACQDIRRMVARSAYAELKHSPLLLLGTVLGLALTFLVAPLTAMLGTGIARLAALGTWGLMALAFWPTLRFYRRSPLWAVLLPAIAAVYMGFTLDSAYQHMRGRGGMWKGRAQALPKGRP